MLLTVDVGNTQTVLGIYQGENQVCTERLSTNRNATSDEIRALLLPLLHAEGVSPDRIRHAVLASVVPQLTRTWREAVARLFGIDLLLCNAQTAGDLFEAAYERPQEIGADRVADAVAARHLYGAPVIVVDFGTATNIEAIDGAGAFRGGVIMPGLQSSADALAKNGSLLPTVVLKTPQSAIGGNTQEALQSGIVFGQAAATDGLVRRICDELGTDAQSATVVATGGLASLAAPHCSTVSTVNPDLTLIGLNLIASAHYNLTKL